MLRPKSAGHCRGYYALAIGAILLLPASVSNALAQTQSQSGTLPPVEVKQNSKKTKAPSTHRKSSGDPVASGTATEHQPSALADKTPKDPAKEGINDYIVTQSVTGSKVPTNILNVPQSVAVVPAKVMEEQDSRSVVGALQNVAGVSSSYPAYFPLDYMNSLYIRGFQVSATLRDGLWDPTPFGNSWLGDVQRIEVVKGPSGLLNGAYTGNIGGVINVVTKKPLDQPAYTFEETVDFFGTRTVKVDLSQPLSENWAMRVNLEDGVYEGFANHSEYDKQAGSVVLQGKLTPDDALLLSYEKRWQKSDPYSGTPGYVQSGSGASATLVALPQQGLNFNLYDPRSYWTFDSDTLRAEYTHAFNANWTFRSLAEYTTTSRDMYSITASPSIPASGPNKGKVVYTESFQEIRMGPVDDVDTDNLINGKFAVLGHDNDLTLGVRYTKEWYDMNMEGTTPTNLFGQYTFTNPAQPLWGEPVTGLHQYMYGDSHTSQTNAYANDLFSITSKLKLSAGINYTWYETFSNPA